VLQRSPADNAIKTLTTQWEIEATQAAERSMLATTLLEKQDETMLQILRQTSHAKSETIFEGNARRFALRVQMTHAAILGKGFAELCAATSEAQLADAMTIITDRALLLRASTHQINAVLAARNQGNGQEAYVRLRDTVASRAHPYALAPFHMGVVTASKTGEQRVAALKAVKDNFEILSFPSSLYDVAVRACASMPELETFCARLAEAL
jgi:hypothetical protein